MVHGPTTLEGFKIVFDFGLEKIFSFLGTANQWRIRPFLFKEKEGRDLAIFWQGQKMADPPFLYSKKVRRDFVIFGTANEWRIRPFLFKEKEGRDLAIFWQGQKMAERKLRTKETILFDS